LHDLLCVVHRDDRIHRRRDHAAQPRLAVAQLVGERALALCLPIQQRAEPGHGGEKYASRQDLGLRLPAPSGEHFGLADAHQRDQPSAGESPVAEDARDAVQGARGAGRSRIAAGQHVPEQR